MLKLYWVSYMTEIQIMHNFSTWMKSTCNAESEPDQLKVEALQLKLVNFSQKFLVLLP